MLSLAILLPLLLLGVPGALMLAVHMLVEIECRRDQARRAATRRKFHPVLIQGGKSAARPAFSGDQPETRIA